MKHIPAAMDSKPAPEASPAARRSLIGWLADHPWLFVVGAFLLVIGVWAVFFTLALKNPTRDVLKDPLPPPASTPAESVP